MLCKRISKAQAHHRARIDLIPSEVGTKKGGTNAHTDQPPRSSSWETRTTVADKARLCRVTAKRVIEELAAIAFSDIGDVFGADGRIIPLAEIPPQTRRAIASYKVRQETRTRNGPGGEKVMESVEVIAVRLHPKVAALAALARYLGMFTQRAVIRIRNAA